MFLDRIRSHPFAIGVIAGLLAIGLALSMLSGAHATATFEVAGATAAPLSEVPPPSAVDAGPVAAPSLTVPPDPIDNPGGALDAARAAWRDGGWLGVTLVAVYLLVLLAKRYVSWLTTGRRAVVVAALLTALVTAISTFTGAGPTLSWAINALVAGVLLYLRPETQAKAA